MGGIKKSMITAGTIGAVAGIAFLSMRPTQQKKIEKSLKKTTDQLANIMNDIHETMM